MKLKINLNTQLFLIVFFLLNTFASCNTPKYTYLFYEGKHLNFNEGKWLLNQSRSNSKIFNTELYEQSKEQFKEILGSSLLEIVDVRRTRIIDPEIPFSLEKNELVELQKNSGCDYLINITGNILTENAGSISFPSNNPDYYATNEASVSIKIYDLKRGIILSSSRVHCKVEEKGSEFRRDKFPSLSTSSHSAMLSGAKKLINKYMKHQIKKGN